MSTTDAAVYPASETMTPADGNPATLAIERPSREKESAAEVRDSPASFHRHSGLTPGHRTAEGRTGRSRYAPQRV
ncbi:hypothetical protein [Streptomyces sp. NPDC005795]|uniref:hypothetical protein n=1 Tax=Streptomyces sp. NPDC005795 TaxID=3154677 RepID=UPI003402D70C